MNPDAGRRSVYFAFQGLFMSVLLLLFVYQTRESPSLGRVALVGGLLGVSVVLLRILSDRILSRWWFHSALFVLDVVVAFMVLGWTHSQSELFLIYLLIVFGSALTRSTRQSLAVAAITILLYLVSGRHPVTGWPSSPEFWLRVVFLAVSASLMAILGRDSRRAQQEQHRRYEERLVQFGRLATLGRLAGEVAHRIKGPLTTISVNAEVLANRPGCGQAELKELGEILEEVSKCKTILKDLLDLGRIEEMDDVPLDLRAPLRAALKSVETQARCRRVSVTVRGLERSLRAKGDASLLQDAVIALLQNAIDAVADGGSVQLRVHSSGGFHRVEISDDGVGISSEDLERIFEPFFTTKKDHGNGLGLSSALRIAAKHGGTVEAESAGSGRGARFTLLVPEVGGY